MKYEKPNFGPAYDPDQPKAFTYPPARSCEVVISDVFDETEAFIRIVDNLISRGCSDAFARSCAKWEAEHDL